MLHRHHAAFSRPPLAAASVRWDPFALRTGGMTMTNEKKSGSLRGLPLFVFRLKLART